MKVKLGQILQAFLKNEIVSKETISGNSNVVFNPSKPFSCQMMQQKILNRMCHYAFERKKTLLVMTLENIYQLFGPRIKTA